ncbi:coactosin-like protein isoform X1 [Panthera tigris]|uniref:coactosin-like protein isoform X1 n=1 Tax=Panthera tigris TaxID=9694 RepID=UPI001C6F9B8C|nr:coactosin-like protein isoform X1 [Panthera tigris]
MATKIDKEACRAAYNLVRDDCSAVIWVTFKYDGSTIVPGEQGAQYQDFIQQCTDDVRLFAFVRFTTGDAMSKRSKFALITWIGENVSGLQRAKTGTDKTLVKEVVQWLRQNEGTKERSAAIPHLTQRCLIPAASRGALANGTCFTKVISHSRGTCVLLTLCKCAFLILASACCCVQRSARVRHGHALPAGISARGESWLPGPARRSAGATSIGLLP